MIGDIISGALSGITRAFMSVLTFALTFILDLIFTLFGEINIPGFSTYSQYLVDFWDLCFGFVGWVRSAFLIDTFSMQLIVTMLIIRYTYKPTISIVKMFVGWFHKLKL